MGLLVLPKEVKAVIIHIVFANDVGRDNQDAVLGEVGFAFQGFSRYFSVSDSAKLQSGPSIVYVVLLGEVVSDEAISATNNYVAEIVKNAVSNDKSFVVTGVQRHVDLDVQVIPPTSS